MSILQFFLIQSIGIQSKKSLIKIYLLLLFVFFLPACSFAPRYERPCMEMPKNWRVPNDETETVVNVRWWEKLNDPVLNELIEEALASNKDLRIATARIAQFIAQLGIVRSELYPQIFGQATASRTRTSQTLTPELDLEKSKNSSDSYTSQGAGGMGGLLPNEIFPAYNNDYRTVFTASYEVDLWGRIRNAANASYAELIGQIYDRRAVILTLVSSVASSYILLRQYDMQLKISQQTYDSRKQSYELAKIRFEQGLTSELEMVQSLAEMNQAEIQVIQLQTLIPQQENLISVLIGHPPNSIERGQSIIGWQLPPDIPAGLPVDLLEQRPDILQAEEQLIATNFRIGEARALYFPDITLTGFYGYESSELHRLFTDPSRTWQWMANLLQPIFTGWRITSTVDLAKARKQEAVYNYLQTILTALQEVDDALIAHKNAKEAVIVQAKRVKDYTRYLQLATLQYENGLVDYLNVLDAERRLYVSQLDLAQGQADVFITLVDIYKALGGGWVVDAENLMKEEWNSGCKAVP